MKLAPYAKSLVAMRLRGELPSGNPFFGDVLVALDNWRWTPPEAVHRIVVPPALDPERLDWSCLFGLHVLAAFDERLSPLERRRAFLGAISAAQPGRLSISDMADPARSVL